MNLSIPHSFNYTSQEMSSFSFFAEGENASINNELSVVDLTIPGNRLVQSGREIHLSPKLPGEIIGERVLRPLIDNIYFLAERAMNGIKNTYLQVTSLSFDFDISRVVPGAYASEVEHVEHYMQTENNYQQPELDTVAIYDKIREATCEIQTPGKHATGFFINDSGLFVTTFHSIKEAIVSSKNQLSSANLEVKLGEKAYKVGFDIPGLDLASSDEEKQNLIDHYFQKADELDLITFRLLGLSEKTKSFKIIPEKLALKEGLEVYFAGFPFTQTTLTFHKGTISSILFNSTNKARYFTIDGTVVPGNSGGPVVIQHHRELYLVGIITSEIVDFDEESFKTNWQLNAILKKLEERDQGHIYTWTLPDGTQEADSVDKLIIKILNVLKRNLSTGIGKAIDAHYLLEFTSSKEIPVASLNELKENRNNFNELPVGYWDRLPGMLAQDLVYRKWYHKEVKGHPLSAEILGRGIYGGTDTITAAEERTLLRPHYESLMRTRGKMREKVSKKTLSPKEFIQQKLEKLKDKVESCAKDSRSQKGIEQCKRNCYEQAKKIQNDIDGLEGTSNTHVELSAELQKIISGLKELSAD